MLAQAPSWAGVALWWLPMPRLPHKRDSVAKGPAGGLGMKQPLLAQHCEGPQSRPCLQPRQPPEMTERPGHRGGADLKPAASLLAPPITPQDPEGEGGHRKGAGAADSGFPPTSLHQHLANVSTAVQLPERPPPAPPPRTLGPQGRLSEEFMGSS